MKKILFLFALLPALACGQSTTSLNKAGTGDISFVDTLTKIATKTDVATAIGITYPGAGIPLSTGAAWGTSITNNSTNWNTAYTDRLKWDGGATGLTAATGRTSLGATTVGAAFFMLTNPSAVTFVTINADNTITARSAANFRSDLSLNNLTNKAQVELEDSVNDASGYLSHYDGIQGLAGKASLALGNLASVAINTTLLPASNDGAALGNGTYMFSDLFLASGGVINLNNGDITLTHGSNLLTIAGGGISIGGGYDIAMTGSIGSTGTRLTKGWLTNLEITNYPSVNGTAINAIFAPLASPNFTGTPLLATNDSLATKAYARSVGGGGTGNVSFTDTVATIATKADIATAVAELNDTLEAETTLPLLTDTITFFSFNFGSGQIGDTALFADNALLGMTDWNTSDSGIVTKLKCRMLAGTGTETIIINICWDTDTVMATVPVKLNTAGYTLTNLKYSNTDVSFNNSIIPPDNVIYAYMSGISAGNKPSFVGCSVQGHKQNRTY